MRTKVQRHLALQHGSCLTAMTPHKSLGQEAKNSTAN